MLEKIAARDGVLVQHFVNWYNTEHKRSGMSYVSPAERLIPMLRKKGDNAKYIISFGKSVVKLIKDRFYELPA